MYKNFFPIKIQREKHKKFARVNEENYCKNDIK